MFRHFQLKVSVVSLPNETKQRVLNVLLHHLSVWDRIYIVCGPGLVECSLF